MKLSDIFKKKYDPLEHPEKPEYLEAFLKDCDENFDTFERRIGLVRVSPYWVSGPALCVFDYKWAKTLTGGPEATKAFKIINKYLKEPNRQQAKSECTEELFNAGLKDYI